MIVKKPINYHRIRKISGSFAFIEHRFLRQGFWAALTHHELILYLFLVLVADRAGLSYYSYDRICAHTGLNLDAYIQARNALIDKDLLAFDGRLFQVLSLPERRTFKAPKTQERCAPATGFVSIGRLIGKGLE